MRQLWVGWVRICLSVLLLAALPVHASIRVAIEGVDGRVEENVRAFIGPPPDSGAVVPFFERRAQEEAQHALEALGYYNAEIRVSREPVEDGTLIRVTIEPGPRVRLNDIDIRFLGDAADDPAFRELRADLPLVPGAGLDHGVYETAKSAIRRLALARGYFDHRFVRQRVLVDAVDNVADVQLHFDSGMRYRLGAVNFGESPFSEELLRRLVPFDRGDPYESVQIGTLSRNLLDSRYFQDVRVIPHQDRAVDGEVPIEVDLTARRPNVLGFGLGASTDTGPRLRVAWDRVWVNRFGHRAGVDLELAEVRQGFMTRYALPLENPATDTLEFQFGFRLEDFEDDVDSERYTAGVQRQQVLGSDWRRTFSFRWERERFSLIDADGDTLNSSVTTELFLPGIGWSRTRTRGGIDPHWGDRQLYQLEGTHPLLGSELSLVRLRIGLRLLRTYFERHRIVLRADGGLLLVEEFQRVPPSYRFLAGGDQSVRGFSYQSLGPGRYLGTGSVEYAYQFRPTWRVATFIDAGNAWRNLDTENVWDDLAIGAGFGLQWVSPVGPVRFDLAWGISEPDTPFRLHIGLGAQL